MILLFPKDTINWLETLNSGTPQVAGANVVMGEAIGDILRETI